MEVTMSEQFLVDLSGLSSNLERKCRDILSTIRREDAKTIQTQASPGWRLHSLKSSPFTSISVDMNFRLLGKIEGQCFRAFRVVKHDLADSAYVNRNDGVETPYGLEETIIQAEDVFTVLNTMGLPESSITPFKGIANEDDFIEALDWVEEPIQKFALALYETAGLAIPRSKHMVFDLDKDFERRLKASMEQWETYLHPSQQFVVELPASYRVAVSGSAGTGKTVCAWHRVQYLAKQGHSVGFVCSNKRILEISKRMLERLIGPFGTDCYFLVPNSSNDLVQLSAAVGHIVMDEGQEIATGWFSELGRALAASETGVTIFYDLNQLGGNIPAGDAKHFNRRVGSWESSMSSIANLANIPFMINYRNSREIAEYCQDKLMRSLPVNFSSTIPLFGAGKVVTDTVKNRKEIGFAVARVVNSLRKDFLDGEIGLIFHGYVRGNMQECLTELSKFGIRYTKDIQNGEMILVTSPRDIKGYERKAIIFCAPPLDHSTRKLGHAIDVYVGMTRARDRLVVLETL